MKNQIVLLVILSLLVFLSFGAYILSQNSSKPDSNMEKGGAMMPKEQELNNPNGEVMEKLESTDMMEKTNDGIMADSRYSEYSRQILENAIGKRRVLFFYASWCPTCRPADTSFRDNTNQIPEDTVLIRVNYNDPDTDQEEKNLAQKYGVTYQHTYVQIDDSGTEVAKWNGGDIVELISNIK